MTGSTTSADNDSVENVIPPPTTSERSRSRSRHRHRSPRRHRNRLLFGSSKNKESNFLAAVASMIVVVLICTALAEPQWFYIRGGGCRDQNEHSINYLGMNQFIVTGHFLPVDASSSATVFTTYEYGTAHKATLIDCVTESMVEIMRAILGVCFLAILMSLLAFLLDLSGAMYKVLKLIREFAIFNIITVLLCVVVNGFCYWATEHLEDLQKKSKQNKGSKVEVEFSVSFYLIAAAGAMSVIATACNLLKKPSLRDHRSSHPYERLNTVPDDSDILTQMGLSDDDGSYVPSSAPPPPYSP